MNHEKIRQLLLKLEETEAELYKELEREFEPFSCDFSAQKIPLFRYMLEGNKRYALSAPVIYAMIIPALVMDLFVSFYQWTCFPLYGIPKVKRRDYIAIDRHRLAYLNLLQKLNCVYCGYFNGLITYVQEIAARTEQFWCPIRHARRLKSVHKRYRYFLPYGDGENLAARWEALRQKLQKEEG